MATNYTALEVRRQNELQWITLNRPEVMNALDLTLWRELRAAVEAANNDDAVRAVAVRGAGNHFSAGYDLSAAMSELDASPETWRRYIEVGNQTCWAIWNSPKPIIAAIDGYCLGGAFEMAIACDFVIATRRSRFGEPEIRFSDAPPFLIAPWILGARRAKDLLLTGDVIDAETADRWGLLTTLCDDDALNDTVTRLSRKLAAFAPETWGQNKRAINRCHEIQGLAEAVAMGADAFAIVNTTPNAIKTEFIERVQRDGFAKAVKAIQAHYET